MTDDGEIIVCTDDLRSLDPKLRVRLRKECAETQRTVRAVSEQEFLNAWRSQRAWHRCTLTGWPNQPPLLLVPPPVEWFKRLEEKGIA